MQANQTPTLVPLPFAANGTKNTIPEASQIGITPGAASLNDGFPPLTFTPIAAGGVPPDGADFNGVLNLITQSIRWAHAGGHYGYSSTFANDANVSGYPRGAILLRADQSGLWINQTENNTTNPDTGGAGWAAALMSGAVGQVRNLSMNVAAASASATLTADEIVVGTALGGQKYVLGGFSKAINLGTTGAGGMDTGSAPVSGFVGIYAIYNPTTGASALLATNATAARVPEVYGGSNMPSGYTASALVSVAPTSGSGQFTALTQRDRSVAVVNRPIISTSSGSSTPQPYTTTVFPKNAVRVKGYSSFTTGAASTVNAGIYADAAGSDQSTVGGTFTGAQGIAGSFDVLISQPQTIYYTLTSSSGAPSWGANCERYDF